MSRKGDTWKLTVAAPFKCRVPGVKAKRIYEECHLMWRAGLISGWYYGKRSPSDPTIVWELNGVERDGETILASLERIREGYGVLAVEWGETWIGYRAVTITYASGEVATERYNAATASVEIVKEAVA